MTDSSDQPTPIDPPQGGDGEPSQLPPTPKDDKPKKAGGYVFSRSEKEADGPNLEPEASKGQFPGQAGRSPGQVGRSPGQVSRPPELERLIYRPIERSQERPHRRRAVQTVDHFGYLRNRLEEMTASEEDEPIVIVAVRNGKGLPHDLLASCIDGHVYARGQSSSWGTLKWTNFETLLASFADAAASGDTNIVFVDSIPYTERSGDISRLIDDVYDDRVQDFEARLRERGFRFFLIVIIDGNENTSLIIERNPGIVYLPWTNLWLSEFAQSNKNLSATELFAKTGDALRAKAEWVGPDDDDRERKLSVALREIANRRFEASGPAVAAIQTAINPGKDDSVDEAALGEQYRKKLSEFLRPPRQADSVDPIKTVMLVIAAFASGTRVGDYYNVCRMLLPEGPAELMRLPSSVREPIIREGQTAERMNRERAELPGWEVVFDSECDASCEELGIHVRAGQAIELDSNWKMIDLKHEIAHKHPGVINLILQRIRDKRLFLVLPEAASELLIDVVCAIRDACGEGFHDWDLAVALTGAELGLGDLGTPLDIVAQLYPGLDPKLVLELINDIQNERLASAFGSREQRDPELVRTLHALGVTPENFAAKLDEQRDLLREESVGRLTRRLVRMRSSSDASENSRPIVACMLDILEELLSPETYIAMLTYMIASSPEVDVSDIGRRLQSKFAQSGGDDIDDIVIAIHSRLRLDLNWENAPHTNWLVAFDPIRKGKAADDRLRALAVLLWDLIVNYDIPRRIQPYGRMKHLRIVWKLFGRPDDLSGTTSSYRASLDSDQADDAMIARIVDGFFARDPADWLRALRTLESLFYHRFYLVQNVKNRIQDTVWAIMTGVAEDEAEALEEKSEALARDVLVTLVDKLDLGFTRDFNTAAARVVKVIESPKGRDDPGWLALYALFWPAMIAHWRFTAFGLEPLTPGSQADVRFRDFLGRLVAAAPQRMQAYRDGFKALAAAAGKCAEKADDMQLEASAARYRMKAQRLTGLSIFFGNHVPSVLVMVHDTEDK